MKHTALTFAITAALLVTSGITRADDTPPPAAADAAPAAPTAMTTPAMSGPLTASSTPTTVDLGPLGKPFITGAISVLGYSQNNEVPGDRSTRADLANGQVFVQQTDGVFQYFIQVGGYSLPSLGTPYLSSGKTPDAFFGAVPQAFIKLVPNADFSVQIGKLPTLIGAEYTFTFENMNIERGLLWNQENAVNRGIQGNYTSGPLAISVSWNDGFYSNRYNWLWGSLAYTFDPANVLSVIAGGNTDQTTKSTLATPFYQNNEDIFNVIYTHTDGALVLQPYLQYTRVPTNTDIGITHSASTFGAGLLGSYAFDPQFSLAGRVEYIGSSGNANDGTPNLLYGAGSKAWSVTVTPAWQFQRFFVRGEFSYTKVSSATPGFVFGSDGTHTSQARVMVETGLLF